MNKRKPSGRAKPKSEAAGEGLQLSNGVRLTPAMVDRFFEEIERESRSRASQVALRQKAE